MSNHPPAEILAAAELLQQRQIQVDIFGLGHQFQAVTPDLIHNYDVIVSIGKTVQYALLANRALYCYDHFGGCGYLNENNYAIAKKYNFSGRGGFGKKSPQDIADEIELGFADNLAFVQQIKDKDDYILENLMTKLLSLPPIKLSGKVDLSVFQPAERKIAEYYGFLKHYENALKHERQIWQNEKQTYENQLLMEKNEKENYLTQLKQKQEEIAQLQNFLQQKHENAVQLQNEKNNYLNELTQTQIILQQERELLAQKNQKRKKKRKFGIFVGIILAGFLYWL